MAINSLTIIYEGDDLSGATAEVVYLPILHDGTVKSLDVKSDANVSGADAVFSVSKNGSVIGSLSPTIAVGSKIGTVGSLNIAVVKDDEIVLNLVSGAVSSPVTFNLDVDDGVSGGTTLPAGDLNASTNKLEKINGRTVSIPTDADLQTVIDDFSGTDYSTKWNGSLAGNTTITESGGNLTFAVAADNSGYSSLLLKSGFLPDITNNKSIELSISSFVSRDHGDCAFSITIGGTTYKLVIVNSEIWAQVAGATQATFGFDAAITKFRFRYSSILQKLYFETFTGGVWTTRYTASSIASGVLTEVLIYAGSYSTGNAANFTVTGLRLTASVANSVFFIDDTNTLRPLALADLKAALNALP